MLPRKKSLLSDFVSLFAANPKPQVKPSKSRVIDLELTAWCASASSSLRLNNLSGKVSVSWNSRMRSNAGRAMWPSAEIDLNPMLKDHGEEEVWRTLKHELAHLVAYERNGKCPMEPHGVEWRRACADLGIPGERVCHTLPFARRRLERKYVYRCPNCQLVFRRVRAIKRHIACYDCCKNLNAGVYHERFRLVRQMP